ncbi:MAG: hypothetical protein JKY54_16980 [Flavobacteriales bacterium]|nr:hypothetical protein [Flavobacteriales bacterium]
MKEFKLEIANGLIIFGLLGSYFIILDFFGLTDNLYLRMVNIAFVYYGVNRCIKHRTEEGTHEYLRCFGAGALTSFIGVFLSIAGLGIYLTVFRGVDYLTELAPGLLAAGDAPNIFDFCVALLIEGLASSVVLSFIIMQRWKKEENVENA